MICPHNQQNARNGLLVKRFTGMATYVAQFIFQHELYDLFKAIADQRNEKETEINWVELTKDKISQILISYYKSMKWEVSIFCCKSWMVLMHSEGMHIFTAKPSTCLSRELIGRRW